MCSLCGIPDSFLNYRSQYGLQHPALEFEMAISTNNPALGSYRSITERHLRRYNQRVSEANRLELIKVIGQEMRDGLGMRVIALLRLKQYQPKSKDDRKGDLVLVCMGKELFFRFVNPCDKVYEAK